jgi:Flp pilus assembly pilin Flp
MIDLLRDESGGSAVEYGLLLSLIFLAIIGAVTAFSNVVSTNLFTLAANLFPR